MEEKSPAKKLREKNSALYTYVCAAYEQQFNGKLPENDPAALNRITKLEISDFVMDRLTGQVADIKTLDGIEELKNLEELKFQAFSEYQVQKHIRENKDYYIGFLKGNDLDKERKKLYELNQISTIAPLRGCKNLKSVSITNQHHLKEVNLSDVKNAIQISFLNCEYIERVNGVDSLTHILEEKSLLDFGGCYNLKSVNGLCELLEKTQQKGFYIYPRTRILLPMITYPRLILNGAPKGLQELLNKGYSSPNGDIVGWAENDYEYNLQYSITSQEMFTFHNKVKDKVEKLCKNCSNPLEKINAIYSYITEEILYDYEPYYLEDGTERSARLKMIYGRKQSARASDHVFNSGYGVGVGISNLFNFMVAEAEPYISAMPVSCRGVRSEAVKDIYTQMESPNHQMSKIEGTIFGTLFFDPTRDLRKKRLNNFALTADEVAENGYVLYAVNEIQSQKNVKKVPEKYRELYCGKPPQTGAQEQGRVM